MELHFSEDSIAQPTRRRTRATTGTPARERGRETGRETGGDGASEKASEKLLPQNVAAEAAVLGALLIDPDMLPEAAVRLAPEDFYREAHRVLFQAACDLLGEGQPSDFITLTDELARRGKLDDAGGDSYISSLAKQVPTSANFAHYAGIVERTATLRRLIQVAGQIANVAYNEPDADAALQEAEQLLAAVTEAYATRGGGSRQTGVSLGALLGREFLPQRWAVPDLLPSGLSILAGKPKKGKSWLALGLALAVASGGMALGSIPVEAGNVLYLALEDTERRLQKRVVQLSAQEPDHRPAVAAWERLTFETSWPALDRGGLAQLERRLKADPALKLVIVDTLAKVRPSATPGGSVYMDDHDAVSGLKQLADRYDVAILLIHHVRKLGSTDPLDEVSGSFGLTGTADNVLVLRHDHGRDTATLCMGGRDVEAHDRALAFDRTTGAWTLLGDAEVVARTEERRELVEAIEALGHPVTPIELAGFLGRNRATIRGLLMRMLKSGELVATAEGKYAIDRRDEPSAEPPASDDATDGAAADLSGQVSSGQVSSGQVSDEQWGSDPLPLDFPVLQADPQAEPPTATAPYQNGHQANGHQNGHHAGHASYGPPARAPQCEDHARHERWWFALDASGDAQGGRYCDICEPELAPPAPGDAAGETATGDIGDIGNIDDTDGGPYDPRG